MEVKNQKKDEPFIDHEMNILESLDNSIEMLQNKQYNKK